MKRSLSLLFIFAFGVIVACGGDARAASTLQPNIVIILADNLGFGDVGCYGATAVKTPNVDRLARDGLRFTSGYATASTCTPSHYSLLTGEYAFRQQLGLAENTLVFFMSDNGGLSTSEGTPTSNAPFRCGKGWVYEGGIREPLLTRWPGVTKAGATISTPVISTDLYATTLAAAGVAPAAGQIVDGRDLRPLLARGEAPARDALFWHHPHYSNQGGFPSGAVRMGGWKLIERYEDGRVHLFNLRDDIGEQHDLAAARPERVTAMRARLHAWHRETGAKFLESVEGGPTPWRP